MEWEFKQATVRHQVEGSENTYKLEYKLEFYDKFRKKILKTNWHLPMIFFNLIATPCGLQSLSVAGHYGYVPE